ncbi:hypothetical protein O1R50_16980 [Glycomyces luteolus]|uniref:Uncharacterized protein n=1 Tax=Glycomyces luteolus TaxID=2670330 RepID=A0A9X3PAB6_9ACTN|nr:hypothetical protein [Glycomyces luteolus]MDA1361327.1 hypothetical protein [Glycomyces luteolus]
MSDENAAYTQGEDEPFGFIDDDEEEGEEVEEDILDADDYAEADRFGMTPQEEGRGTPLGLELSAEEAEVWAAEGDGPGPGDPISDEPAVPEGPDGEEPPPDEPAPPRP